MVPLSTGGGSNTTVNRMNSTNSDGATDGFEALAQPQRSERYFLRLFLTGMTPRSVQALANIRELCEEHLQGRYDLDVIDMYQHPGMARDEQIVAAPTLVKKLPAPVRRLVGNLSDTPRVLAGLNIACST